MSETLKWLIEERDAEKELYDNKIKSGSVLNDADALMDLAGWLNDISVYDYIIANVKRIEGAE